MVSIDYFEQTGYSFAFLLLSAAVTLVIGFFVIFSTPYRTTIGFSAFLAGLMAVIANIISLRSPSNIVYMGSVLSALYSSFTLFTILYTFDRLSKNDINNRTSQPIVRIGYFWILVTVVTGLVLSILLGKSQERPESYLPKDTSNLAEFFFFSNLVFIAIIWILFGMLYRKLSKRSRQTMASFIIFITSEAILTLVFKSLSLSGKSGLVITFIFTKLPTIAAILFAANYGMYWIKDSDDDGTETELCNV